MNQRISVSDDRGDSFQEIIIPNSPGNRITDFRMFDEDGAGYCIGAGQIFQTSNGGST
jgi:hypothetical protein